MPQEKPLTILIVGSGGREHALARACHLSPLAGPLHAAPGNPGMAEICQCHAVAVDDVAGLAELAASLQADFVIVGPEVPLALGLVDALQAKGILAFGPKADGGRLEASKSYTKELLLKNNIPTGAAAQFDNSADAIDYLETSSFPIVVKADGLAAGKGVIIAESHEEACQAIRSMLDEEAFGESGKLVLLEECLFGEETSIHVIVSGMDYVILPTSQDHKPIYEGDKGPNTGGMGAYSPADLIDDALMSRIEETIVKPSIKAIADEGIDFRGTLFIGLMITKQGPKVLEYNTRFGDPETQVLLPRLETDPLEIMLATARGQLGQLEVKVKPEYATVVVLASEGYPGKHPKGEPIELPADLGPDEIIFHAGTQRDERGQLVTSGGRVLGATALGPDLQSATAKAYALCDRIHFKSKYLRRDIGAKELHRSS